PVIVITARDDETEIVGTLDAGADDYVVKPFSAGQLEARLRAVLRRGGNEPSQGPVRGGGFENDPAARLGRLGAHGLGLWEWEMVLCGGSGVGGVAPKGQRLAEWWTHPLGGGNKTVDVPLPWLRRKLGETAPAPKYLRTVHGVGVRLVAPSPDPADRTGAAG